MSHPQEGPGDIHLRTWADLSGESDKALAGKAGIGQSYFSDIAANNKIPSVGVLFRLADALGLDNPRDLYRRPPEHITPAQRALLARFKEETV